MAAEIRSHIQGERWGNGWLNSGSWDDDLHVCELIHLPVRHNFVQGKLLKGEGKHVSWALIHVLPGWVILGLLRFVHAFYLPGHSGEEGRDPVSNQKSEIFLRSFYSLFSSNGSQWWLTVFQMGLLAHLPLPQLSAPSSSLSTVLSGMGLEGSRVDIFSPSAEHRGRGRSCLHHTPGSLRDLPSYQWGNSVTFTLGGVIGIP